MLTRDSVLPGICTQHYAENFNDTNIPQLQPTKVTTDIAGMRMWGFVQETTCYRRQINPLNWSAWLRKLGATRRGPAARGVQHVRHGPSTPTGPLAHEGVPPEEWYIFLNQRHVLLATAPRKQQRGPWEGELQSQSLLQELQPKFVCSCT